MHTQTTTETRTLRASIESSADLLDDKAAAALLDVSPGTLSVWRSTGRYNLPYLKVGRLVKYRISDLAEFLASRTAHHTGERF